MNERATDARVRHEKRMERKRERRERGREGQIDVDGEGDGDGEEDEEGERLRSMQERVRTVSDGLEGSMRGVVDSEVRLNGVLNGIGELEREDGNEGGVSRRRTRRAANQEDEEGEEEEGEGESEELGTPPIQELNEKIGRCQSDWEGLSLTERWVSIPSYIWIQLTSEDTPRTTPTSDSTE